MMHLLQPKDSKYGDERIAALSVIDWARKGGSSDPHMLLRVNGHSVLRDIEDAEEVRWHDAIALTDDMPKEQFDRVATTYAGGKVPLLVITDAPRNLPDYAKRFTPVPYKPL